MGVDIKGIMKKIDDAETVISKVWPRNSSREHINNPDSSGAERCAINYWNEYYPTGFRKFTFSGDGKAHGSTIIILSSDENEAHKVACEIQDSEGLSNKIELVSVEVTNLSGETTVIYYDNGDY